MRNGIDQRLQEAGADIRGTAAMLSVRSAPGSVRWKAARPAVAVAAVALAGLLFVGPMLWLNDSPSSSEVGAAMSTPTAPSVATTIPVATTVPSVTTIPVATTVAPVMDFPYLGIVDPAWSVVEVSEEGEGVYDGVYLVEFVYLGSDQGGFSQMVRLSMAKRDDPEQGPFFGVEAGGDDQVLEEVDVRGHTATLLGSTRSSVQELFLHWNETNEVEVLLAATGLDRQEVLDLVATLLQPISVEAWNELLATN